MFWGLRNTINRYFITTLSTYIPSCLISGFSSIHFPPLAARAVSGSEVILDILSNCSSSLLFCSMPRYLERFLLFATLAAEIGIVLENNERSRIALAERTRGGRKRDIPSDGAARIGFCSDVSIMYHEAVIFVCKHTSIISLHDRSV